MTGEDVRPFWRFVVVVDHRGGGLIGRKGTILRWHPRSGSLVETVLDDAVEVDGKLPGSEPVLFYHEEIELLGIVDQLAWLARLADGGVDVHAG